MCWIGVVLCILACTTNTFTTSQHQNQEKKTNIPLVPTTTSDDKTPSAAAAHLSIERHPVVHEYVSDRAHDTRAEKKHSIPVVVNSDPYASIKVDKINKRASKRFELYPKWFSNKVPSIFGKRFSKNYYYPFIANNKIGRSRDTIARRYGMKSRVHELPVSWLAPAGNRIRSRSFRRRGSAYIPIGAMEPATGFSMKGALSPYEYGPPHLRFRGEMVDIPDTVLPYNHHGYSMSRVPHGLMQRMNPAMYEPLPSKFFCILYIRISYISGFTEKEREL